MGLIVSASDIDAEKKRTLASAQVTDQAIQSCSTIDATTKTEWTTFYAGLTAFCSAPTCNFYWYPGIPSGCTIATANAGDSMLALENMLSAWQKRIGAICANAPPSLAQFNPNPAGAQVSDWLRYGAIIAGFVGSAYVVAEVVPFISALLPKRRTK